MSPAASRLTPRTTALLLLALVVLGWFTMNRLWTDDSTTPNLMEFRGSTMGTTYAVKSHASSWPHGRDSMAGMIDRRLAEVNRLMSTYDPESEISRFNRHGRRTPFTASRPTIEVFETAWDVSRRTGGAFDATVGPLVDAWGFGPTQPNGPPTEGELTELLRQVGYHLIEVNATAGTLVKSTDNVATDLSAIAKGYGVDQLAEGLIELGINDFLVEIGGEVRGSGLRPDGSAWRVGIEAPTPGTRTVVRVVNIHNTAVATSGDYRNFLEHEGVRLAHIIDARTGRPIPQTGKSVTVLHAEAMWADAWATALTVLEVEDAHALAERERIAALFITDRNGKFDTIATTAFEEYDRMATNNERSRGN